MQILSLIKIHLLPLMKNSHTIIFHTGSCQERCPSQICVGFFQLPQCPSTQTHLQKNYFSKISPSLPSHISNLFFSPLPSPSSFCLSRTKHLPTPENSLPFFSFLLLFQDFPLRNYLEHILSTAGALAGNAVQRVWLEIE